MQFDGFPKFLLARLHNRPIVSHPIDDVRLIIDVCLITLTLYLTLDGFLTGHVDKTENKEVVV